MNILDDIEKENQKKKLPQFEVGDTVDVHMKITEGDRERVQLFNGIVIGRKGGGIREAFTVRRIVQGEGVERVFPIHSPLLQKVTVKRKGKGTRRAKLYYLRDRVGKAARLKGQLVPGSEEEPVEEAPKVTTKTKDESTDKKQTSDKQNK